jgi:hypothetical protein
MIYVVLKSDDILTLTIFVYCPHAILVRPLEASYESPVSSESAWSLGDHREYCMIKDHQRVPTVDSPVSPLIAIGHTSINVEPAPVCPR